MRPFAPTSFWNAPLSDDAKLDAESKSYVAELRRQVRAYGPWINAVEYSTPVYTVPADQPTARVTLDEVASSAPELQRAWERVPIPDDAKAAPGSDKHLVVWQPSTDTMWEFWLAEHRQDGWHARWGGRMENLSENPGHYTAPHTRWGATATSLPLLGGLMRLDEMKRGRIDHALALSLPEAAKEIFSWPAQRTDGWTWTPDINAIPEGTRFRLDPRLDIAGLDLPPLTRMMAEAAQRYGIVVRDKAGAVAFYGEDPGPTGHDPYPEIFAPEKWANHLLADFPWEHLQALKTDISCCWVKQG